MPESKKIESKILKKLYETEKAILGEKENKYIFLVFSHSNKIFVKKEVERLYKVKVTDVNIVRLPSKKRRVSREVGYESGKIKAIVTLKKGDKISIK